MADGIIFCFEADLWPLYFLARSQLLVKQNDNASLIYFFFFDNLDSLPVVGQPSIYIIFPTLLNVGCVSHVVLMTLRCNNSRQLVLLPLHRDVLISESDRNFNFLLEAVLLHQPIERDLHTNTSTMSKLGSLDRRFLTDTTVGLLQQSTSVDSEELLKVFSRHFMIVISFLRLPETFK